MQWILKTKSNKKESLTCRRCPRGSQIKDNSKRAQTLTHNRANETIQIALDTNETIHFKRPFRGRKILTKIELNRPFRVREILTKYRIKQTTQSARDTKETIELKRFHRVCKTLTKQTKWKDYPECARYSRNNRTKKEITTY